MNRFIEIFVGGGVGGERGRGFLLREQRLENRELGFS